MSYSFIHLEEIPSTNTYLKELLLNQNLEESVTVYADFQSSGRGQRGNTWEADRGANLLFSTLFFPNQLNASRQFIISEIISLAIKNVLDKYIDDISIKWPNDIYWRDKKIAGILIENSIQGNTIQNSIIGVGLNLNQKVFRSEAPNPISLYQITGKEVDVSAVLYAIMDAFNCLLNHMSIIEIHDKYMESLFRKEGYHLYKDVYNTFKAKIMNVQPGGILELLHEDGSYSEYGFKEVQFVL